MRERGYVNGESNDQGFEMSLPRTQKKQYGLQFGAEESSTPGIVGKPKFLSNQIPFECENLQQHFLC